MRKEYNCVTGEVTEHEDAPVIPQTPAELQAAINAKALAYLQSTDWYSSRKSDTGEPTPPDITAARAAARKEIK